MSTNTVARSARVCALDAATLCEAFQISAATHPQRVALRLPANTVALMLTNRPEFHWVDVAAMHLGATTFGVYNTFAQDQVDYVLHDSGATVAVTEQTFASTLRRARQACPRLTHLVSVDGGEGMLSLDEVDAAGDPAFELSSTWPAVDPDDVVTLIYTSGTTGPPKGVQITHAGVIANARALHEAVPAFRDGFSAVRTCRSPTPSRGSWSTISSCCWVLVRGQQAGGQPSPRLVAEHAQADALVLAGLRGRLGLDRVETAVVGAAPTPPEVIEFFWALGVPLCEGYGMSEVLISTVNPIDRVKIGTVDGYLRIIDRNNAQLSLPEKILRWTVLDREWLPGGEELTPTMKLQRRPITTKYAGDIEALYR